MTDPNHHGKSNVITEGHKLPREVSGFSDLPKGYNCLSAGEAIRLLGLGQADIQEVAILRLPSEEGFEDKNPAWVVATSSYRSSIALGGLLKRVNEDQILKFRVRHVASASKAFIQALYESNRLSENTAQIEMGDDNEVNAYISKMLNMALTQVLSDLHIEVHGKQARLRARQHGALTVIEDVAPSFANRVASVLYTVLGQEHDLDYNNRLMQSATVDYLVGGQSVKLRYQSAPAYPGGFDVVLRVLPTGVEGEEHISLESRGYSPSQIEAIMDIIDKPVGATFVAGVTGSGKSTTLRDLLLLINVATKFTLKIITLEDPPEYKMTGITQIPIPHLEKDKEKYEKKSPFAEALEAVMRMDPDVIMLGEVRDPHTGQGLQQATQTGHKVFSTIHTSSAIGITPRLNNLGVETAVLGSPDFLIGLMYQRLVPVICPNCSVSFKDIIRSSKVSAADLALAKRLARVSSLDSDDLRVRGHDPTCRKCGGKGIIGRTVCAEIIQPDTIMLSMFRENDIMAARLHWRSWASKDRDDPDMTGRPALEHAIWKARRGKLSVHDVEKGFGHIDGYLADLEDASRSSVFISKKDPVQTPEEPAANAAVAGPWKGFQV